MTNDIEIIFTDSRAFKKLRDDVTRQAVHDFVIQQTFYKNPKLCLANLCSCVADMSISNISVTMLIAHRSSWSVPGYRKMFLSFLEFACEQGYIKAPRVNRLTDFKHVLSQLSASEQATFYLLNDDDEHYSKFQESSLFENLTDDYSIPTYSAVPDVTDDQISLSMTRYFDNVKFSSTLPTTRKAAVLSRAKKLCSTIFHSADSITIDQFVKGFQMAAKGKAASSSRSVLMEALFGMLLQFNEDGLITDRHLKALVLSRETYDTVSLQTVKEILQSEHPEYWCVVSAFSNSKVFRTMKYINCASKEIREAVHSFLNTRVDKGDHITSFCEHFDDSLQGLEVNGLADLGFTSFTNQVDYFQSYASKQRKTTRAAVVVSFYLYLAQHANEKLFEKEGVPTSLLTRPSFANELKDGFKVILYNLIEDVPEADKWLLCYKKYDRDTVIRVFKLDFTRINDPVYRIWYKHYVWKDKVMMYTKAHPISILAWAFNYLAKIKSGKIRTIFPVSQNHEVITVTDASAYRNHVLASFDNNRTRSGYIYNLRNVLRHVSANKLGEIDNGVFYALTHTLDQSYDNTHPISNNELSKIATVFKRRAEEDPVADVFMSIFYLALETEFRGSQIVDLNKDCLHETAKKGEFEVVSETKTSADEVVEQPISSYVERGIRHVIAVTESFREASTNTWLLNKLFVIPGPKKGTYVKVSQNRFNVFFQDCCKEAGVPAYTLSNLRDTHMTKAEEYRIRHNLSDLEQGVLTGHKTTTVDDRNYVRLEIREMLEAVHGVTISNVKLDGTIITNDNPDICTTENEVADGCGFCKSDTCGMMMNLDCPMCNDFVTTISRLPYFEEQVRILDKKIEAATVPHDKEDLVVIKVLMLRYIEEILNLKERIENAEK
ncbi:hypothetical protein [Blautia sp. HCP28S3_G10]|uniref:hypothetical protein n=1 Tax=Blautia sp. HCP28S3_G10 TaxID=3438908 RepID=UPI003F8B5B09